MNFAQTATVAAIVVALIHLWFLVLEMFLWQSPVGRRTFGTSAEFARESAALAANQGLYNGFLAVGLLWGVLQYGVVTSRGIVSFFLGCMIVAGVFGAITANKRILFVQAVPAAIALALAWLA
ncbi:MAG TPA: DUF1304 domain-containing protein [Candidatus Dormibacteraeota bacterium]|nr:DUF1304 domain-containing protein [Candidatus Dormibacteraeota bacterium]